jgi:hypothetical protein
MSLPLDGGMVPYRLTFLTLPLAAASIALGACGGGDPAAAGTSDRRAEFREAAVKFAKCMREHGVDMPDPQPGQGGRITLGGPGMSAQDQSKMESAQKACQKILESVKPPEMSAEQEQKFKNQALKFARCMREHGINMPDPQFQGGGRITQRMQEGVDPSSQRFRDAAKACSNGRPGGFGIQAGPPE